MVRDISTDINFTPSRAKKILQILSQEKYDVNFLQRCDLGHKFLDLFEKHLANALRGCDSFHEHLPFMQTHLQKYVDTKMVEEFKKECKERLQAMEDGFSKIVNRLITKSEDIGDARSITIPRRKRLFRECLEDERQNKKVKTTIKCSSCENGFCTKNKR